MAEFLANLTNGQIDEKGFLRLLGTMLTQSGVVQSGSLLVAAQGTPDMTVKVSGAATGHDIVFIASDGATYHGWNTADKNVTISSNATGVTKKDAIIAYADLTAGSGTSNNPGALKFIAVRGSGTNTAPDNTQIQATAVGTNPYVVLAHVTVSNGASSINSGNISDQRPKCGVTNLADSAVTTAKIADGSVTNAKLKTGAGEPGGEWTSYTPVLGAAGGSPAIGNGSIVGRYKKVGRTVEVVINIIDGTTTNWGTGQINVSLPPYPLANQSGWQGTSFAGGIYFRDTATRNYTGFVTVAATLSTTLAYLNYYKVNGTALDTDPWTASVPVAIDTSDSFHIHFSYEADA